MIKKQGGTETNNSAPSYYHPLQVTFMRKGTLETVQCILGEAVIVKQTKASLQSAPSFWRAIACTESSLVKLELRV